MQKVARHPDICCSDCSIRDVAKMTGLCVEVVADSRRNFGVCAPEQQVQSKFTSFQTHKSIFYALPHNLHCVLVVVCTAATQRPASYPKRGVVRPLLRTRVGIWHTADSISASGVRLVCAARKMMCTDLCSRTRAGPRDVANAHHDACHEACGQIWDHPSDPRAADLLGLACNEAVGWSARQQRCSLPKASGVFRN